MILQRFMNLVDQSTKYGKTTHYAQCMKKRAGFTLIELIITMSVALILVAMATPSFRTITSNNRMSNQINQIVGALNTTRSEAVTRGLPVTVCKRNTTGTNCDTTVSWEDGWIIFTDNDEDGNVDGGVDTILRVQTVLGGGITIAFSAASNDWVTYASTGFPAGNAGTFAGTFTVCDSRGAGYAKAVVVLNTGRSRRSSTDGSSNPLAC